MISFTGTEYKEAGKPPFWLMKELYPSISMDAYLKIREDVGAKPSGKAKTIATINKIQDWVHNCSTRQELALSFINESCHDQFVFIRVAELIERKSTKANYM